MLTSVKLYTDLTGRIREVSEPSCVLLNIASVRSALNRSLPLYFIRNRHRVVEMMEAASLGFSKQVLTVVRTGRRHLRVVVEAHRIRVGQHELLEWMIRPLD